MIVDSRVLEEDFVPGEVLHRHDEVSALSSALEPLARGGRPDPVFLFGPTGAGKTCIARFTMERLQAEFPPAQIAYVNCWQDYTRFRVLYRLLEAIDQSYDIHRSTPKDELFQRLEDADAAPIVAVLDEVDQLEETEALYDLHRLPHVALVLIANREVELFASLDDRIRSRLQVGTRLTFDRYGTDELVGILEERAHQGLEPGVVDGETLRIIADAAVGDARVAIAILRTAARAAEQEGREGITEEILEAAIPDAQATVRRETLEGLHEHQRVLYDIITEAGEIEPGELYAAYEDHVEDPKTTRTLRNYLSKMAHYDLVEAIGEKRGRRYRPVGESASAESVSGG